ncbi:hypothetical protein C451_03989 [Halococcus thailandensis JCM 13552]|uniref:UspA domain-containing protein n=2 Tax=Halococcus thailandensis TaxID=335952 RepID=M0NEZ2_9EURY|nr:hypothetical protein C451_03989 [Halococcus thailandensis JCM 13552]
MLVGDLRSSMTFVVPFDGSALGEAALVRAVEYGAVLEEEVVVVSVVSERERYARQKGWVGEDEAFDVDTVVESLRERTDALAPEATFECERIREFPPAGGIADHIERMAQEHDPSVLFLGSDNLGRVVTPLASVAANIAPEEGCDLHIVRRPGPPTVEGIAPHSEFYDED